MASLRRAPALALAALLSLGTLPGAAAVFNPETFTLDNGLQVVVIPNHRVPVVMHMVVYKVGAADEPLGKSGIAHFLEHLMFRGTDDLSPGEFSKLVARNGGRDNAFTTPDYTGYHQQVARDRLELVMQLEADRMVDLSLTDAIVEPERDVILEERRSRIDNSPPARLREQVMATLYRHYPYRIPTIGWEHEMRTLDRGDAIAFYRQWYAPNNAILIVAGDITGAEVRPLAEAHYGKIPARPVPPRARVDEPPQVAPRRVVLESEGVGRPSWRRYYDAPSYIHGATDHAEALQLLSEVLGGGSTSRLYEALVIRDRVADSAGSWYDASSIGPTVFGVYASPRQGVEIETVEKAVETELRRLLEDGIAEDELERAKQRLVDGAAIARDSMTGPAYVFANALAIGRTVEHVETWPDAVRAVSKDAVEAAARHVLDEKGSVTGILLPKPTS